jgi:membrane protease YdiL (CAAX protease family)
MTLKNSLIILVAFLLYYILLKQYISTKALIAFIEPGYIRSLCFQLTCLFPIIIALFFLFKPKDIIKSIGLNKKILLGIGVALLCTLPMIIGNAIIGTFNKDITLHTILSSMVYAGFFEEVVFRGFLFGLLFRYAKWGFIPAVLIGALMFGAGHLYQGSSLMSALAPFGVTALGAVWFSWMYVEWSYNLWVSIAMHMFMNASWILFKVSSTATGDLTSNAVRGLTIVAIIVATIMHKKKHCLPYLINKKTLWINKD